ncbi:unnamed protein product [Psylliodes chrysocephalus]|uniref:Uncharacterized protein n=1 Tax=Psylliodes chrysocephalus TaxID=3402493 RepID=A0A9P0GLI9_9CUCU|nr:unnamed protein product [Psylliodes chrysocephala]
MINNINTITLLFISCILCDNIFNTSIGTEEITYASSKGIQDFSQILKEKFVTNNSETTAASASSGTEVDIDELRENIRDIGYYLRSHKFNEYDRRYETNSTTAERIYFKTFPRPPLRSLHWEVHKYCESSFMECVNYLAKKLRGVAARRTDDTSIVMMKQHWKWKTNTAQIEQVDEECKKNKKLDDHIADPFEGPLERYQWRVTASYFMCWYTMKKTPELKRFHEKCDNFANCLDYNYGPYNDDARVDDLFDFSCALYSFCPNPCCPLKYANMMNDCLNSPENPCYRQNNVGQRACEADLEQNSEFRCICHWGYIWDEDSRECLSSMALSALKLKRKEKTKIEMMKLTLWEKIKNIIFWRKGSSSN